MKTLAATAVALVALLHLGILVLEMFLWSKPTGRRVFGLDSDFAERSKALAANQGLYNGFLAAGLVWGLLQGDAGFAVKVFFVHHRGRRLRRRDRQALDPLGPGAAGSHCAHARSHRPVELNPPARTETASARGR